VHKRTIVGLVDQIEFADTRLGGAITIRRSKLSDGRDSGGGEVLKRVEPRTSIDDRFESQGLLDNGWFLACSLGEQTEKDGGQFAKA
jgi:hypothetical protein